MRDVDVILMPLLSTVFGGLFSTNVSQGAKFNDDTLFAGTESVCVGKAALAGCSTVTMAD